MIRPKRSNATRGGLERLPTRKPLQLSTVTCSSKGALQSLEVQNLASLTNSTCQAAAALVCSSPALRSRADIIARESDLDMLAARCLSDRCVIKLTCG